MQGGDTLHKDQLNAKPVHGGNVGSISNSRGIPTIKTKWGLFITLKPVNANEAKSLINKTGAQGDNTLKGKPKFRKLSIPKTM